MYSTVVLDHFAHPRHFGALAAASAVGRAENPGCGDVVELSLTIAGDAIAEARFRARGCVATIACCSRLCELLPGTPAGEAGRQFDGARLADALGGLPPTAGHAAELTVRALRSALADVAC